jgi:hypothetical protein
MVAKLINEIERIKRCIILEIEIFIGGPNSTAFKMELMISVAKTRKDGARGHP